MRPCWEISACAPEQYLRCPARQSNRSYWHLRGGLALCPWAAASGRGAALEAAHREEEESLRSAARAGDQEAFEQLLEEYGFHVRRLCHRFFLPGAEREDLHQEGMAGLVRAILTYDPDYGRPFVDHVTMCNRNALLAAVRSASRRKHRLLSRAVGLDRAPSVRDERMDPARVVLGREALRQVGRALRTHLSHLEYHALVRRLEGEGLAEIGRRHGVTPKQVENALFRARRKVRACLA